MSGLLPGWHKRLVRRQLKQGFSIKVLVGSEFCKAQRHRKQISSPKVKSNSLKSCKVMSNSSKLCKERSNSLKSCKVKSNSLNWTETGFDDRFFYSSHVK